MKYVFSLLLLKKHTVLYFLYLCILSTVCSNVTLTHFYHGSVEEVLSSYSIIVTSLSICIFSYVGLWVNAL